MNLDGFLKLRLSASRDLKAEEWWLKGRCCRGAESCSEEEVQSREIKFRLPAYHETLVVAGSVEINKPGGKQLIV